MNNISLELHVSDFEIIKKYYTDLGFDIAWEREPEGFKGYLVMTFGNSTLCFWAGNDQVYEQSYFKRFPKDTPRGYGVEVVIIVDKIEEFYEQHKDKINVVEPLKLQPWGLKDFRAVDPAGYYLRFSGPHDVADSKYAVA